MIIAGNWKMNMDRPQARVLAASLSEYCDTSKSDAVQMIVFPPAILIDTVMAGRSKKLGIGGQDCHYSESGAHTGDISPATLAESGCGWVLVGHSERRVDHGESNLLVRLKAQAAHHHGLIPIICLGESLTGRQSGSANAIVGKQLAESLDDLPAGQFLVAYEPIWAIGTGQVASLDDIAQMHDHLRACLLAINPDYGSVPLLYGGSVKPDNARDILSLGNVGGALVGGASLKADDFIAIAQSC